jgi:hypothetical protein
MDVSDRFEQLYRQRAGLGAGGTRHRGGLVLGGTRKKKRGGVSLGGRGTSRGARHNPWVEFVYAFASANGMTYAQALKDPRTSIAYHSRR